MGFLRHAARAYLIERLSGRRHHGHGYPYGRYGYGRRHSRPVYPFRLGRPRRRTRVHVTGCCLPIPLGLVLASSLAGALLTRRRR